MRAVRSTAVETIEYVPGYKIIELRLVKPAQSCNAPPPIARCGLTRSEQASWRISCIVRAQLSDAERRTNIPQSPADSNGAGHQSGGFDFFRCQYALR